MSGALKAVGKAFKKVTKVVKKIAVPALIVGAVVLTGGAALGALPAVSSVLASAGITGTVGTVLTGAVTQAGYGALIGGATAALSGKNIMKGATKAGLIGAATGGIAGYASTGALGATAQKIANMTPLDAGKPTALPGTSSAPVPGQTPGIGDGVGVAGNSRGFGSAQAYASGNPAAIEAANAASMGSGVDAARAAANGATQAVTETGKRGFGAALNGAMDFANKNPLVASAALQGIGSALAGSEAGEEYRQARKNYGKGGGGGFGLLDEPAPDYQGGDAAPMAPITPGVSMQPGGGRFAWNAQTNRVEWITNG